MEPVIISQSEWAFLLENLDDIRQELHDQLPPEPPRPDMSPPAWFKLADRQLIDDYEAIERLLQALPATGPVTICPGPDTDGQVVA